MVALLFLFLDQFVVRHPSEGVDSTTGNQRVNLLPFGDDASQSVLPAFCFEPCHASRSGAHDLQLVPATIQLAVGVEIGIITQHVLVIPIQPGVVVLIAELHGFASRRIAKGLHTANDLTFPESRLVGSTLCVGNGCHDRLGYLALKIGQGLILRRLFLRFYLIELADG
jgi:hypothetical protein